VYRKPVGYWRGVFDTKLHAMTSARRAKRPHAPKISPRLQLLIAATAGACLAAALDAWINGAASGVAKAAALAAHAAPARPYGLAGAWLLFGALGPAAVAYFRPLTPASALSLGFGAAAALSMLLPSIPSGLKAIVAVGL
jgi:hypothetical protein